jgi:hypothetical protein
MGFANAIIAWAVLAIALVVPTVAALEAFALTRLTELELGRIGVAEAVRTEMMRAVRRYVSLGVFGSLVFSVACFLARRDHANAALVLGVSGVMLWRWAAARADECAEHARRTARADAATRAPERVGP